MVVAINRSCSKIACRFFQLEYELLLIQSVFPGKPPCWKLDDKAVFCGRVDQIADRPLEHDAKLIGQSRTRVGLDVKSCIVL